MAKRTKVNIEKMGEYPGNMKIYKTLIGRKAGLLIYVGDEITDHSWANIMAAWEEDQAGEDD